MRLSRRQFLLGFAAAVAGCRRRPPGVKPFDQHVTRGAAFLASQQAPDGSWRSDLEGTFKDGTALTPLVLTALLHAAPDSSAIPLAAAWLAAMAKPDGSIAPPEKHGFDFPVYTAALAVTALSHRSCTAHRTARDASLRYLRERQLTDALGWRPDDPEFGGWGYSHGVPRRPSAGELIPPYTESNLSATTFALAALTAAKVELSDPAFAHALRFVMRCQNWADADRGPFDDGGFFFIAGDPVRNKAGVAGIDDRGRERYRSYGSTTADGLRCLTMCGLGGDPRADSARTWLRNHPKPDPGGTYYYGAASMAQASAEPWTEALAAELIAKQREDGSWASPHEAFREHEPLVATAFACLALAHCQGPRQVFPPE